MNTEGLWTRENLDGIEENDGLLIVTDSGGNFIDPEIFREYIGSSTDPDALGVPVPTATDAGKVLAVNETGNGFFLKALEDADLLWENPDPKSAFSPQTITCDNTAYSMFAVYFGLNEVAGGNNTRHDIAFIPKNAGEIRMTVKLIQSYGSIISGWRNVTADDGGISFGGGYYNITINGTRGNNARCVPLKIYGFK